MIDSIHSIHVLGSREFGGADQFFVRLVRALKQANQSVSAITRPGSPVAMALKTDPIENILVALGNRWDVWSAWKIRKEIGMRDPCVVQTYMGRATRLTRVPEKLKTVHIARLGGFYKIDGYYRHADAWVGNTKAICDFLVKSGLPSKHIHHIGNFVPAPISIDEEKKAALRNEHQISDEAWILFALGRLVVKKGFDDLLEAIAKLPPEIAGRPMVLLLAGDGPERTNLEERAKALGITSRVRFLGWQDPPDHFYSLADLFICPSRHEPLGNVILEAWNHSLPVVSTRSHGAVELIEDGVTGVLCECRDADGMAASIRELLNASSEQRQLIANASNAQLHARHGQDSIVGAYLSLYRSMLAL